MDSNETNKLPKKVELEDSLIEATEPVAEQNDTLEEVLIPEEKQVITEDVIDTELATEVEEIAETPVVETTISEEPVVETPVVEETVVKTPIEPTNSVLNSKEEIVSFFKKIADSTASDVKEKVDGLKQSFYKLHKAEVESARKLWIEAGNTVEEFSAAEDALEVEFKNLLNVWREKRAEHHAEQEKQRQSNLEKKVEIIEHIRLLTESTEDIGRNFPEFRRLQISWKETGPIPQEQVNELWKNYQMQVERFYDLLKINNEFREYDFKKNLEIKTNLCETAEKLVDETDVVVAFRQLQKLHEEWRETGPVAKDFRDEIWNRFKLASSAINKNHQGFFEKIKGVESENLEKKTEICEQMEAIDFSQLKSYKDWDAKTTEIIALQEKWKTIGFAPKKANVKIFERFRAACDSFFRQKSDFYKSSKDILNKNLDNKKELCEKAEALKNSTDWKATAELLIQLQKEWKTIGPVPKKFSDAIWKRFIAACDFFFEEKEKNAPSQKNEEQINLASKKELIAKIEAISDDASKEDALKLVHELTTQWNATGHVPFKEKDKIYKAWHDAVDSVMDRLHLEKGNRRTPRNFEDKGTQGKVLHERERLLRQFDNLTNEIKTSENNIGFFTTSKSSKNSLLDQMKQKIEELKEERDVIYKKIKEIDDSL